jgi:hypothetical protein
MLHVYPVIKSGETFLGYFVICEKYRCASLQKTEFKVGYVIIATSKNSFFDRPKSNLVD